MSSEKPKPKTGACSINLPSTQLFLDASARLRIDNRESALKSSQAWRTSSFERYRSLSAAVCACAMAVVSEALAR